MYLDFAKLVQDYGVSRKGVIHIGAHEGQEVGIYLALGFQNILLIEANPFVFKRLNEAVGAWPNVRTVNCAISNRNGSVRLRVTSFDMSSSILPLKHHLELYPGIQEQYQLTVEAKTLDSLLEELHISPSDYSFMNVDIQGAELMAFQGAAHVLRGMEAIATEINFAELYEGCAIAHEIDAFLGTYGFRRVATETPAHPTWGDAFYAK